ncbi:hypothetical protein [Marinobacter salarius]|uniref:Uncharacterized protein n=1 Tax=Marinobacter salarius TaxID=1420917 RepID=A0A1W6KFU6_9GAMM|nr:hypothetical protein [Marinobacter salarius]ARM86271.1 hypothetical protein MARSALSMR5_04254 [Marinobacter salarius]
MAHIKYANLAVTRDNSSAIESVRFLLTCPLFGESLPESPVDGIMIENNGPHWLGHTLNLNVDGDEVVLNVEVDEANLVHPVTKMKLTDEIADFIQRHGTVEVIEHRIDPAKIIEEFCGWEPRAFDIPCQYFETHFDFVREFQQA